MREIKESPEKTKFYPYGEACKELKGLCYLTREVSSALYHLGVRDGDEYNARMGSNEIKLLWSQVNCYFEEQQLHRIKVPISFTDFQAHINAIILSQDVTRWFDNLCEKSISQSTRGKIEMDILELIQGGERDFIEFKETLRWDTRLLSKNPALERVVMKTIAAFNNKEGGTLIMGVSDDGTVKGLDNDFNTLAKANKDGFELHLRELIKSNFGEAFAAGNIKISFPEADEISICRVDIKTGSKPLFLKVTDKNGKKEKKFYVRSGNSSPEMPIDEAFDYISNRF